MSSLVTIPTSTPFESTTGNAARSYLRQELAHSHVVDQFAAVIDNVNEV